ncbi:MAG: anhydro-N-acetylmuramic acid kinase [Thermodesulfobacteriota bacterium]|nr:MAG: anhydro-N-acetylmuramic acid kinase [Thermodesulfobacteriota bacterium]
MSVELKSLIDKKEKYVIGLMSGTSKDGIDAVLVKLEGNGLDTKIELLKFICIEYDGDIQTKLNKLIVDCSLKEISDLNFLIGGEFAKAALEVINQAGLSPSEIDLIGSHGQTVFHNPPSYKDGNPSTLQIGEIDVIAEKTGITTVGDFRTRDIAAGGEAAPLVPYLDYLLFRKPGKVSIAQNIGGIANATVVTEHIDDLIAFDTGPGNMLMDRIIQLATNGKEKYDKGGQFASVGNINQELLNKLLVDPYYSHPPPKSTGEELFGQEMATTLHSYVDNEMISLEDMMATLLALTVESIVSSYKNFIFPKWDITEVIFSGGGCNNHILIDRLREELDPIKCSTSNDYGIPSDAKEAVAFAILANELISGNTNNLPGVTGAQRKVPLGKISLGRAK